MSSQINPAYILLGFLCLSTFDLSFAQISKTGGYDCVLCTFAAGIIEQLGQIHNESITKALERFCKLLDQPDYRKACELILDFIGPTIIDLFYSRYTPDVICAKVGLCPKSSDGLAPKCHLFPPRRGNSLEKKMRNTHNSDEIKLPPLCKWPGAEFFCDLFEKMRSVHSPLLDLDKDGFSSSEGFRGSAWRGKDCDDFNSIFHPGLKPLNNDIERDSNCNGIYGLHQETGEPYEKVYCEHSQPRGLMLIGDSAGAHFHIPEQWIESSQLSSNILTHLPYAISNEFDWPMTSFSTGYKNLTWPVVQGYTISVYDFLKKQNRCNHRDYHNFGVNGDNSARPPTYLNNGTVRNQTSDIPLLLFYEFVGNDVCNRHNDTLAHMTTPEEMRKNVIRTLDILDTVLPNGSHVLMTGLANGSVLWEALSNRFYPLGRLNKDICYPDFYDFLSCIGANPCSGWMTTNDTLRILTTKRAYELSDVVKSVAKQYKNRYAHFDVEYIECPFSTIVERWKKKHGKEKIWELIEAVDGFHPNQLANNLIAEAVWDHMERHLPHYIGPVNPHNSYIAATFRDQGGY